MTRVKIAPRPAQIIPKSIAHSSLLASIVTSKFVDALPLYRQEQIFAREGIELSRPTMAGLLIQLQTPLQPVAAALKDLLRQGRVVHIDETPVQILREPGRDNTQDSYMPIPPKLDSHSSANWTLNPPQTGRLFQAKLDSRSEATHGVDAVYALRVTSVNVGLRGHG